MDNNQDDVLISLMRDAENKARRRTPAEVMLLCLIDTTLPRRRKRTEVMLQSLNENTILGDGGRVVPPQTQPSPEATNSTEAMSGRALPTQLLPDWDQVMWALRELRGTPFPTFRRH
jgi:hypothetical protein